jgi:transcriptional regulator with XRE-family HTH domain
MTLGEKIEKARRRKGLYRRDLAKITGITYATLKHYEYGNSEPSLSYAVRICDALGITLDYLARDEKK